MHERIEVGGERWEELLVFHIQPLILHLIFLYKIRVNKMLSIGSTSLPLVSLSAQPGPKVKSEFDDSVNTNIYYLGILNSVMAKAILRDWWLYKVEKSKTA